MTSEEPMIGEHANSMSRSIFDLSLQSDFTNLNFVRSRAKRYIAIVYESRRATQLGVGLFYAPLCAGQNIFSFATDSNIHPWLLLLIFSSPYPTYRTCEFTLCRLAFHRRYFTRPFSFCFSDRKSLFEFEPRVSEFFIPTFEERPFPW